MLRRLQHRADRSRLLRIAQAVSSNGLLDVSALNCTTTIAASPLEKLEFKDVCASPCEVVQVGKSATDGVASTALYGSSRGGVGWIHQFD
jgi:hypothetical protein